MANKKETKNIKVGYETDIPDKIVIDFEKTKGKTEPKKEVKETKLKTQPKKQEVENVKIDKCTELQVEEAIVELDELEAPIKRFNPFRSIKDKFVSCKNSTLDFFGNVKNSKKGKVMLSLGLVAVLLLGSVGIAAAVLSDKEEEIGITDVHLR